MVNQLTQCTILEVSEIFGQEIPKKIINSFVNKKRLPNTLIFWGPPGVGKFTLAISLASKLTGKGELIIKNRFPDFLTFFPHFKDYDYEEIFRIKISGKYHLLSNEPGNILIEDIREIINNASMTTFLGGFRFFVIVQAERMTEEANQAFLKLLEEPNPNNIFILITEHKNMLIDTIRSRGTEIRFRPLKKEEIIKVLKKLNLEENSEILEYSRGIEDYMFLKDNLDLLKNLYMLFFKKNREERLKEFERISEVNPGVLTNLLLKLIDKNRRELSIEQVERILNVIKKANFYIERNVNKDNILRYITMEV